MKMSTELIWMNGVVTLLPEARVNVEDRGYQYSDGVYEVIRVYNVQPFTLAEHLDRMERSAKEIRIALPISKEELARETRQLIAKSKMRGGMIYMQISRGIAPRDHRFPANAKPVLLFYNRELPPVPAPGEGTGLKLVTLP